MGRRPPYGVCGGEWRAEGPEHVRAGQVTFSCRHGQSAPGTGRSVWLAHSMLGGGGGKWGTWASSLTAGWGGMKPPITEQHQHGPCGMLASPVLPLRFSATSQGMTGMDGKRWGDVRCSQPDPGSGQMPLLEDSSSPPDPLCPGCSGASPLPSGSEQNLPEQRSHPSLELSHSHEQPGPCGL